jgi:hypothetical protein
MSQVLVRVVVDREFGERLEALPRAVPVWIVDSPANTAAAQRIREEYSDPNAAGITTFRAYLGKSPERLFLSVIATVDLHHGESSQDPPYTAIEVIGGAPTAAIHARLAEVELAVERFTEEGFVASREAWQRPR